MIIIGGKEYPFEGVLFLDIDGVLNSQDFYVERHRNDPTKTFLKRGDDERDEEYYCRRSIDPKAVAQLNYLLKEINYGIVLSSTWRSADRSRDALFFAGIENYKERLIGYTPLHIAGGCLDRRGNEILAWIQRNNYRGPYIALDDDADFGHIADCLVKTQCAHGLTAFIVKLAIDKIRKTV